ncbi:acyltransferase [Pseudomonas sp. PS02303]|uniref:acyltransferase family protein n=1 Tax=Pseudomonas sp. PS02303 TaxID=2991429 RepID=UPI00249AE53D|nr:acyltransferase [Pseudomonas sp. PS02303]
MEVQKRFEGADGIRGLACLIVLFIHALALFFPGSLSAIIGTGKSGVWLFFVLSAFLLTSKFVKSGFSMYENFSYCASRFLRIIPLFSVVVIFYYWQGMLGINTAQDLQNALLLRQGFVHLWTIPVEFKFYAFLPFMAFFLIQSQKRHGDFAALLVALGMIAAQQYLWPYWESEEVSVSPRWYLSCFTIGCYVAVTIDFYRRLISPRAATVIGLSVISLMVLSTPIMRNIVFGMPFDKWLMNKFLYVSFLWGVFIAALVDGKGIVGRFFKTTVMKKLGAWSFSIYLAHWQFYVVLGAAHTNSYLWMTIGMACSIGFGAILHYSIEAPIEKFRHSIQKRFRPKALVA